MALSAEVRIELARNGVRAYNEGDAERALAMLHPDIECYSEGLETRHFRGIEAFQTWIAGWDEAWASFEYDVQRVEAVGERHVVAVIHQIGTGRDSGIEVDQMAGFVFDLDDDGRARYFALYMSPERALAGAREREGLG